MPGHPGRAGPEGLRAGVLAPLLMAAALGRVGPAPGLGGTAELALVEVGCSPKGVRLGEVAPPLAWAVLES